MRTFFFSTGLAASVLLFSTVQRAQAKAVFAHYMVGGISQAHVQTDIDNAISVGFDGFALNVGDPTADYTKTTIDYLFNYAATKNFKLFISMDIAQLNGLGKNLGDYYPLLSGHLGAAAWYKGPNGFPFLSTFSDGGYTNTAWSSFKQTYANQLYFVPDFDSTQGYYTADPGWWSYWGGVVDGVFSWESAWPNVGNTNAGDISLDQTVVAGTKSHGKSYMMPLSTLQYKNAYGVNLYRQGGLNFPIRMKNILSMGNQPDFVQVITWNDGGESHYVGNIWPEADSNTQVAKYASSSVPHSAWQPLIRSFIRAYKAGQPASAMTTSSGTVLGAIWYKNILQSSSCPNDSKPQGFSAGTDAVNWAIVVSQSNLGYRVRVTSNGAVMATTALSAGLNYGTTSINAGAQVVQVIDSSNKVILTAQGGRDVSGGCPDGIYNMNYQVVGLS
ncbi:Fc.00g057780.m01.CDS01 [Cosmosporella sp. VM-42]